MDASHVLALPSPLGLAPSSTAEQASHADDPAVAYVPRGHAVGCDDPSRQLVPAGQGTHTATEAAPGAALYVPPGHGSHAVAFATPEKVPAGQVVQSYYSSRYEPGRQPHSYDMPTTLSAIVPLTSWKAPPSTRTPS